MSNKNSQIGRSEFLQILSSLSKEEINTIIAQKGKDPKPIKPFIFLNKKC